MTNEQLTNLPALANALARANGTNFPAWIKRFPVEINFDPSKLIELETADEMEEARR